MGQLMMRRPPMPAPEFTIPSGLTVRPICDTVEEIAAWIDLMAEGELISAPTPDHFDKLIRNRPGCSISDCFVIEENGNIIASITSYMLPDGDGDIHMVACSKKARGRGMGKLLMKIALKKLTDEGCNGVVLTTDDFRVPAIATYLADGFCPVLREEDHAERWARILKELGKRETVHLIDNSGV